MRLDKQSILSDAQDVRGAAIVKSENSIDLGDTGMVHGFSASAAANGRVPIRRRIGSKGQRFMGQIIRDFIGATSLEVNFVVGTGVDANGVINAGRKLLQTVTLDTVTAGTAIPWPNIPRYLTERYFALEYLPKGAASTGSDSTGGQVTAGFVEDVPDHDF